MKSLAKILTFTLLIGLSSFFLVNHEVSANENYRTTNENELNRPPSIQASTTIEIDMQSGFPPRIWYTRGDYGGYLTLDSFEKTPNNTYLGLYRGTLRLYAAPDRLDPDKEEK